MKRFLPVLILGVAILSLTGTLHVLAQSTSAKITGTVKDESGAVLPGVTVNLTHKDTASVRSTVTDDAGRYLASNLALGAYEIEASLPGFSTAVASGIQLSLGQEALVDLTLKVGATSEKVTVTAEAPLIETQSSALSSLVDESTIRDLPLNGRDYIQLATLSTGVIEARSVSRSFATITGGGTKLTVSGARPDYNQILLDGTDMQDAYGYTPGGVSGATLGVDTLREFRVLTNSYSAEYGRAGGAVINTVTKSGTNEIHGSLFEYHRNSYMDARNFFDKGKEPPHFVRNQFGFTAGGPVVRDKTFFFGSYEGLRERLGTSRIANVPTAATRQGIVPLLNGEIVPTNRGGVMTSIGVNPAIRPYLDLYPLPTPGGIDNLDGTAQFLVSRSQPIAENYFVVKIDQKLSDSDSFFGRYTYDNSSQTILHDFPGFSRQNKARRQVVTLEEKKILSATLLNVFRFGFNRAATGQENNDPGLDRSLSFVPGQIFGQIAVTGLQNLGTERVSDLVRVWNHYEFNDSLDFSRGRHSMTMGVNYKRIQVNGLQGFARYGQFHFLSLRHFLQNQTNVLDVALPQSNLHRGWRLWQFSSFFQDNFQVSPRLTLNLGIRYDFASVPTEVNGLVSNLREARLDGGTPTTRIPENATFTIGDPFYKNPSNWNFAPRIGFAWSPFAGGKTAVRGGFGIFYALILPANFQISGFAAPPFTLRLNIPGAEFPRGWLSRDTSSLIQNLFVQPFDFEPKQPTMYQYNLTLQQEFLPGAVLTLGYAGSRGVHLSRIQNVNMSRFILRPDGSKFFPVGTTRPNKNFAGMGFVAFDTASWYHALQIDVKKRLAAGLQLQGAYTFSKTMDASAGDHGGSSGGVTSSMDPFDWRRDWGLSSFDVRHNFSFNGVWDLPFRGEGALGKIAGGWQFGSIVRMSSGIPVNITMAGTFDPARAGTWWVGDGQPQRPNLAPGASNNPRIDNFDPNVRYLDPAAFRLPELGTFGNLGRNTVIGPTLKTVDFSLVKNTMIRERTNIQFRVEMFNAFNRANFSQPNTGIFSNASGVASPTFSRISDTSTTARQIQLALKITF